MSIGLGSSSQGYLEGVEGVTFLRLGRLPEDLVFRMTVGRKRRWGGNRSDNGLKEEGEPRLLRPGPTPPKHDLEWRLVLTPPLWGRGNEVLD